MVSFVSQTSFTSENTFILINVEVMMVKLKTLRSECFLSRRLYCEDYCYILGPFLCSANKN